MFRLEFLISFNKKDEESLKIKNCWIVSLYILAILIISRFAFLNNPTPIFCLSTPVFYTFSKNICTLEPILSLTNSLYAQKDLKKTQQKWFQNYKYSQLLHLTNSIFKFYTSSLYCKVLRKSINSMVSVILYTDPFSKSFNIWIYTSSFHYWDLYNQLIRVRNLKYI